MESELSAADFERLARERYVSLATFRKSGAAVPVPIWAAPAEGKLYVVTGGDSAKIKRLRNSDRARLAACDARGSVRGEWTDVRAHIIADPALVERAMTALRRKYGWQIAVLDFFSRLSGRVKNRAFLEIEF